MCIYIYVYVAKSAYEYMWTRRKELRLLQFFPFSIYIVDVLNYRCKNILCMKEKEIRYFHWNASGNAKSQLGSIGTCGKRNAPLFYCHPDRRGNTRRPCLCSKGKTCRTDGKTRNASVSLRDSQQCQGRTLHSIRRSVGSVRARNP